jgi:hypothetical protein
VKSPPRARILNAARLRSRLLKLVERVHFFRRVGLVFLPADLDFFATFFLADLVFEIAFPLFGPLPKIDSQLSAYFCDAPMSLIVMIR